jgi:hypothetical protein
MMVNRFAIGMSSAIVLAAVTSIAAADRIRLSTGETLDVRIIERDQHSIRFAHPVLGELTLPTSAGEVLADDVESPNAPVSDATKQAHPDTQPDTQPDSRPETQPAAPTSQPGDEVAATAPTPKRDWKFRLTLGGASTTGNSETANVSGIFTATRETPQIKTALDASYFYGRSDGETSENRFSTGFRHDWLNPGSDWFYFIDGRYDHDQFQSWDHRVQSHFGVGYHLIEPPKIRLDLLAGLGAVKEWGSDNDGVRPEGLLGIEGEYVIAPRHTITFASTIYPDLSNIEDFRWVNSASWAWTIDKTSDLALTAGLLHEHQSRVDAGRDRNDLRIYAGVQLDF